MSRSQPAAPHGTTPCSHACGMLIMAALVRDVDPSGFREHPSSPDARMSDVIGVQTAGVLSQANSITEREGLVSVVIIFFNEERFLDEAVASVYAQSYPDWELLLVDDGSSDGSSEIARGYVEHDPARIRYLEHPGHENRGEGAARNLGVHAARGEWIAFLDGDDVWLPNRLERSVALALAHRDADMIYARTEYWQSWKGTGYTTRDRIQPHHFRANRLCPAAGSPRRSSLTPGGISVYGKSAGAASRLPGCRRVRGIISGDWARSRVSREVLPALSGLCVR